MGGPGIVAGVDLNRKYRIEEILEMHAKGMLRPIGVAGYIVRADADGMVGFVPASESTLFRMPGRNTDTGEWEDGTLKEYDTTADFERMREDVNREHPMVRRRAQEKRESLVQRLLLTAQQYGTIPGLTDEQISTMIGEKWTTGVSVVTAEMLSRVSAYLLGQGEVQNKEHDRHRTTRDHALA